LSRLLLSTTTGNGRRWPSPWNPDDSP